MSVCGQCRGIDGTRNNERRGGYTTQSRGVRSKLLVHPMYVCTSLVTRAASVISALENWFGCNEGPGRCGDAVFLVHVH